MPYLVLLIIITRPIQIQGQDRSDIDFKIWADLFADHTLRDNLRLIFHVNYKHLINNGKWQQVMMRPVVAWSVNRHITLQGGVQGFYTDEGILKRYEIRPWQGLNLFIPGSAMVRVNQFIRLEERFFYQNQGDNEATSIRGRYAIMTRIPLNKPLFEPKTIYIWPSTEFFAMLGGNNVERFIENSRYSLGLGYQLNEVLRMETVYLFERSRDTRHEDFNTSDHALRLILRYSLQGVQDRDQGIDL